MLSVRGLGLRFGGLVALRSVSLDVARASITALIGPNGAGKTTLFNCITGFYRAQAGTIAFDGGDGPVEIGRLLGGTLLGGSHRAAKAGIARTFQNIRLFREMTCMENLLVAEHTSLNRSLLAGLLGTAGYRKAEQEAVVAGFRLLDLVGMPDAANVLAGDLPYGLQRRLEIARAMASAPKLICLDEPAAGLNPRETAELAALIRRIRDAHGITVLLVEHDMHLVMGTCEHVVVLDRGAVIAAGPPEQVKRAPAVVSAYLEPQGDDAPRVPA